MDIQNTHRVGANTHRAVTDTHRADTPDKAADNPLKSLLPQNLQYKIPPAETKPRKTEMTGVILEICAFRAFSASELTTILGRKDKKNLVRKYLTPLVEEGKLHYSIPEMPDHPDQKYACPPK